MDLIQPRATPPLLALGDPGKYQVDQMSNEVSLVLIGHKGLPQIRLNLEGGYELDIPVSQETLRQLQEILESQLGRLKR